MPTLVSEFFIREIADWRSVIDYHLEEISEAELRLKELLSHNTVPQLGERTEGHIAALNGARRDLLQELRGIDKLEAALYENKKPVANEHLERQLVVKMKVMRKNLFTTERLYLEKKFRSADFLADCITIQNRVDGGPA